MTTTGARSIRHLDLSKGVPPLPSSNGYRGLYVVFWWQTIPLGHQEIHHSRLPMPATQVAEIALQAISQAVGDRLLDHGYKAMQVIDRPADFDALTALEQPLDTLYERCTLQARKSTLPTSVVVCTRDRPEYLERCLKAIEQQTRPPVEVIVVDNAPSTDTTRRLVEHYPGVRYVLEPRPGLDIARNTGVRNSRGEIVAFTDDDVEVHPEWLVRLQAGFEDETVMAVTGLVLPAELDAEAQVLFERFWGFNRGYRAKTFDDTFVERTHRRGVPVWDIGAGANMAFRRRIFDLIGGFDERLDVGAAGCCGDSEFWYRILNEGWRCRYEPAAVAFHHHRRDDDDFRRQVYDYMRAHVAALLMQFERYGHSGNLRRLLVTLPRHYLKLTLQGLRGGFKGRRATVRSEIAGCLAGLRYYVRHRRDPSVPRLHQQPVHATVQADIPC